MKVAILMSTYNGEKYLSDQINSIINQKYDKWNLYIRDDGSSDNTVAIINSFCKKDKRIHLLKDKRSRLGPKNSFFTLLRDIEADCYFFSDQDDVWKSTKIGNMLKYVDYSEPQVIYCGLQCTDSNLIPVDMKMNNIVGTLNGKNRFVANDIPGCTMAINQKLRKLFLKGNYWNQNIMMHDWWLALIGESFGNIVFLDQKLVYYRQHGNNTLGAGKNRNVLGKFFAIKEIFTSQVKLVKGTWNQSNVFYKNYNQFLDFEFKKFLEDMISCRHSSVITRIDFFKKYKLVTTSKFQLMLYKLIFVYFLNCALSD